MKLEKAREIIEEWWNVEGLGVRTDLLVEALDTIKAAILGYDEECDNDCEHCTWTECPKEPEAMSKEMVEHYRKLAEHYDKRNV